MNMRFCDLCRLETRVDVLERVHDVFPLSWLCPACAVEVREDEAHPRDPVDDDAYEPACDCRSACAICTPGA